MNLNLYKKKLKTYILVLKYISQTIQVLSIFALEEEFEDTKGVIRIRKSKKDRQHNDQN
jgi:hypothetical protein